MVPGGGGLFLMSEVSLYKTRVVHRLSQIQTTNRPLLGTRSEILPGIDFFLTEAEAGVRTGRLTLSSDIMYRLNGFRKSTPPQNRQLVVYLTNSKQ